MRSTFRPLCAKHAHKLIADVVLPHPPFWLAIEIILIIPSFFLTYYFSYQKISHHDTGIIPEFVKLRGLEENR
jgi:hypothetical protein